MITFKCKMCGGDLNIIEGNTVCECEFCGTQQTIPTADNEKKTSLFNRANRLRMNAEFDKASAVYESIVAEFPEEAEAYWGLCLCAYGIEYVDDPATGEKKPTCHRTVPTSIMEDSNFEQACENADAIARRIYREEAKAIDIIQRDILTVVSNEEPYDVFICYKETAEEGGRTEDSVLAQDIYDSLTSKGLKVFFARITLEDKLGQQYEPYIYAALSSAKVMLAIGTKFEYYDAVWVKNEWARFLDMMKGDKTKTLIPCYKGIDAYDMPREFKNLQAQDMGKLGWLQDLTRGVMKLCGKDEKKTQDAQVIQQVVQAGSPTVDSLLARAFVFLEDEQWNSAVEYADKVLDVDVKSGQAYLVKLMASLKVQKKDDLKDQDNPFDDNEDYQKIMRFGDDIVKTQLRGYVDFIKDRNIRIHEKSIYDQACALLKQAHTPEQFEEAKSLFQTIPQYYGVGEKLKECDSKGKETRRLLEIQEKVNALRKSAEEKRKAFLMAAEEQIKAQRKAYETEMQAYNRAKQKVEEAENALNKAQQEYQNAQRTVSMLQIELINVRGLFSGKRKREMEEKIAKVKEEMQRKQTLLGTLKEQCERERAVHIEMPVKPDQSSFTSDLPDDREVIYQCAKIYAEAQFYESAIKEYLKIPGYKDVDDLLVMDNNLSAALAAHSAYLNQFEVGKTVVFGHYQQNNNTDDEANEIEWVVLANDGERTTLITVNALDYQPYMNEYSTSTWETCSLRKWLNDDFLNAAFTEKEKAQLETVTVVSDKNPDNPQNRGNDTRDRVFLLSIQEVKKYFPSDSARICFPTAYAKAKGAYVGDTGATCWWLRSSENVYGSPEVYDDGTIDSDGVDCIEENAVRPVIVLRLS